MPTMPRLALLALFATPALAAPGPTDPDTKAWWATTTALSTDSMRGRDTGSPEHRRAAEQIAAAFAKAGLKPAGDTNNFLQKVQLHEVEVTKAGTSFAVARPDGKATPLKFLHDISVIAHAGLPATIDAPIVFRGYCGPDAVGADVKGKVVLCFAGRRKGMPNADARSAAVAAGGAIGLIAIEDIGFTVEPPRWPSAYARELSLPDAKPVPAMAVMRFNADALPALLAGSGQSAPALLAAAVAAQPLANFDTVNRLRVRFNVVQRDVVSENVVALLPGTDPAFAGQAVVVSAHLEGYGIGEPVNGDAIYNGAFDDAAYVATLIQLARDRAGKGFRRPVYFAAFTGEEKGLLGARWFAAHPPVSTADMSANINLDAIRPLFPLKILTVIGHGTSSLTATIEAVAKPMGITVRPDLEPERGMANRTDASIFLKAGVPAVSFMFGYDPGSAEEAKFRLWYRTRYHKPQDDVTQPIDFTAARDFNRFFYALTAAVADGDVRPALTS